MIVKLIDFLLKHIRAVVWICLAVLILLVICDWLFVDKEHAHTKAEHIPGFWAAFGFVSCLLIIFVSKWYGHMGIMKKEDYYGDE